MSNLHFIPEMRHHFPLLDQALYFNTAYVGLPSKPLMDFRASLEHEFFALGDGFKSTRLQQLEKDTATVARFLNAPTENTFLVHNFSIGIRYCTEQLPKGTKVLTIEEDYPSLLAAFKGEKFHVTTLAETPTIEAQIQEALQQQPYDVLAISKVNYTSGLKFSMEALHAIKKTHPELLIVVDGTQWVGTEIVDFKNNPIDVLVGSGYKWLLAGFSSGYLCCSDLFFTKCASSAPNLRERISIGHYDYLGTAALAFAVQQLEAWDFSALMQQKRKLEVQLQEGLKASNRLSDPAAERKTHSGIFNIKGDEGYHQELLAKGIHCAYRGTGIRLSVHFYNTSEEITRLLEAL